MDRGTWFVYLLLLCVCYSLDTHRFMGVDAISVSFETLLSTTDIAVLQCTAGDLQTGYVLEWARDVMGTTVAFSRNGTLLDMVDSRYSINSFSIPDVLNEFLSINDVGQNDSGVYYCRVKDSVEASASVVAEQCLSYGSYFPSDMYPICSPNGPFTVREGTTQLLSCSTQLGNPLVTIHIIKEGSTYLWVYDSSDCQAERSLELTVSANDSNTSYECKITSANLSGIESSCTIGPIMVLVPVTSMPPEITTSQHNGLPITEVEESSAASQQPTDTQTGHTTTTSTTDPSFCVCTSTDESDKCPIQASPAPWISAFIVILVLFLVLLVVNIFTIFKHRRPKTPEVTDTVQLEAQAETYMELQPTDDKDRAYEEPTSTTVQQTYSEPPEETPEYDYAQPKQDTKYEVVGAPHNI